MRVLILGVDGYIGWALAQYLAHRGHEVIGLDDARKRTLMRHDGCQSALPIVRWPQRVDYGKEIGVVLRPGDVSNYARLRRSAPQDVDVVVHLAQLPSAPYSMRGHAACWDTQENNIGTNISALWWLHEYCNVPMITLGTMGEYGTPDVDIPEGDFELEFRGRKDRLQFPRKPASLYHASKVASSSNCEFACRTWGLRITDIMQGVVYGSRFPGMTDDRASCTALHIDETWGTAINRFCAQAVAGHPLTVYGAGTQERGAIPLRDALRCIELLAETPPEQGEYRVVNQFDHSYSILHMAETVARVAGEEGIEGVQIERYPNPRVEDVEHYYNPDRQKLVDLGYEPVGALEDEVRMMLLDLLPHRAHIKRLHEFMVPKTKW